MYSPRGANVRIWSYEKKNCFYRVLIAYVFGEWQDKQRKSGLGFARLLRHILCYEAIGESCYTTQGFMIIFAHSRM